METVHTHGPYEARYKNTVKYFRNRHNALAWARKWSRIHHSPIWVKGPSWGDEKDTTFIREVRG